MFNTNLQYLTMFSHLIKLCFFKILQCWYHCVFLSRISIVYFDWDVLCIVLWEFNCICEHFSCISRHGVPCEGNEHFMNIKLCGTASEHQYSITSTNRLSTFAKKIHITLFDALLLSLNVYPLYQLIHFLIIYNSIMGFYYLTVSTKTA